MNPSQDEPTSQRVGVVDIGSNSIRLVAFDVRRGLPFYLFNEKALGRLGQGLATTGHLSAQAIDLALDSLTRFAKLSEALQLDSLFLLATAAVRDATDGPDFVTRVEEIFGAHVAVLSGEEEARLSALGVLSGLPGATGIAADLGGGSLELAELQDDQIGQCVSLPLGPLRLVELADGNLAGARAEIDRQLDQIAWLKQLEGRTVYLVGGAWRALAHMHMARTDYDLRIVHGYTLRAAEVASFAAKVAKASPATLARMPGAAQQRLDTLPYAALALRRLIALGEPRRVCFSAYGLREGRVRDWLLQRNQAEDPLIAEASWIATRSRLSPEFRRLLMAWTSPLFSDETDGEQRLRRAACKLSNIAWHEHRSFKSLQALEAVLRAPNLPLRHSKRAFLSLAVRHRYGGAESAEAASELATTMLGPAAARRARILGLALRLAYRLSAGSTALLEQAKLRVEDGSLILIAPPDLGPGGAVQRDLEKLARAADLAPVMPPS